jgi:hypothetical protein
MHIVCDLWYDVARQHWTRDVLVLAVLPTPRLSYVD